MTTTARRELCEHFDVATLDAFGCEAIAAGDRAANAVLQYLKTNQPQGGENAPPLQHLKHLWTYSLADYMTLDAATRRNLELTASLQADGKSSPRSLFGVLDQTVTAMGARLFKRWIQQPLLDLAQIHARLDAVEEFHRDSFLRGDIRKLLDGLYDVERLVGRIGFGNANARDLIGLKRAVDAVAADQIATLAFPCSHLLPLRSGEEIARSRTGEGLGMGVSSANCTTTSTNCKT